MKLSEDSKIYVAGHRGLVGSAIMANLRERGFRNVIGRTHAELDLLDSAAVERFFDEEKPDAVVLAAAHVGGIMATPSTAPTLSSRTSASSRMSSVRPCATA